MPPRLIIKAAEWTLTEDTTSGSPQPCFRVLCLACGAESDPTENDPQTLELWAIKHTGMNTDHRQFRLFTQSEWRVDPTPGNPLHEQEKGQEVEPQ